MSDVLQSRYTIVIALLVLMFIILAKEPKYKSAVRFSVTTNRKPLALPENATCYRMTPDTNSFWYRKKTQAVRKYTFNTTQNVWSNCTFNYDVDSRRCLVEGNKSLLFVGHCFSRSVAEEIRHLLDRRQGVIPRENRSLWTHHDKHTSKSVVVDFMFMTAHNMPTVSLQIMREKEYDYVFITSGLWEMMYYDRTPADAYEDIKTYYQTIRDANPKHTVFIVANNYLIRRMADMQTLQNLCVLEDRQQLYQEIIQCAALSVFGNNKDNFMYYNPFRTTYAGSYLTRYRPIPNDGMHYKFRSPVTQEWRNAVLRGICRPKHLKFHFDLDTPVCADLREIKGSAECHIACRCSRGISDSTSYCKKFLYGMRMASERRASPSTCYGRSVPEKQIMDEYQLAQTQCKGAWYKAKKNCYTHFSPFHKRWTPILDIPE
eukprot:PhF_6_TR1076/c1_g1_i10/m.2293